MAKIENEKVEVNSTKEMNDKDLLNDILQCEKNESNNYSCALNEMSNKVLYKKVFTIFKETKEMAREAYNLAFSMGWYTLETAQEEKLNKALTDARNSFKEL